MTLAIGLMALVFCLASPVKAASAYHEMSDAELTEVLQGWGSLASADRRGLLVELRKRMQRSEPSDRALVTRSSRNHDMLRPARITIHVRVRQNMRFGAGVGSRGVFVVRSGNLSAGDAQVAANAARQLLAQMRSRMANAEPLLGPGFGDGFERRQDFLKASVSGDQIQSQIQR